MSVAKRVSTPLCTGSLLCAPILCASILGALSIAGVASAQTAPDPSLSAPSSAPPSASGVVAQPQSAAAQDDAVDAQIAAWTNGASPGSSGRGGASQGAPAQLGQAQGDDTPQPRQIHGEAGVAFGNHGYRSGYVTADIPVGQTSDLGVGVSDSQYQFRHGGTVNNKSLFLSLSLGTGRNVAAAGCRSQTIPTDGRYLEPMWEAQAHGEALARDQQGCAPVPNDAR